MNVRVCSASAFRFLVLAWVVCLQWTGASWARQQDPSQTEIEKLIEQLSSDSFDARREAKDQLASLGVRAVPALAEAAGKDTDAAYSAVRILSRMLSEGDARRCKNLRRARTPSRGRPGKRCRRRTKAAEPHRLVLDGLGYAQRRISSAPRWDRAV